MKKQESKKVVGYTHFYDFNCARLACKEKSRINPNSNTGFKREYITKSGKIKATWDTLYSTGVIYGE